jgi:twinkle protein
MNERIKEFYDKYLENNQHLKDCLTTDAGARDLNHVIKEYIKDLSLLIDSRFGEPAEIKRIVDSQNDSLFSFEMDEIDCLYDIAKENVDGKRKGEAVKATDIESDIYRLYDSGSEKGIELDGFSAFSQLYRFKHGQMNVITGVPSHGKSEWLDQMLVSYMIKNKMRFVVFSPENYPLELHITKLVSKLYQKSFFGRERLTRDELTLGIQAISRHFVFLTLHEDASNLESLLTLVLKCHEEEKIDGFIIDPWNELEHNRPANQTEPQYIGNCLTNIRRFGRKHNISPFIVAHPTKLKPAKPGEPTPLPVAYDINGGAMWYNKADNIISVYRNNDNTVDINVQKIKFKFYGKKGTVTMYYDFKTGCYSETKTEVKFDDIN